MANVTYKIKEFTSDTLTGIRRIDPDTSPGAPAGATKETHVSSILLAHDDYCTIIFDGDRVMATKSVDVHGGRIVIVEGAWKKCNVPLRFYDQGGDAYQKHYILQTLPDLDVPVANPPLDNPGRGLILVRQLSATKEDVTQSTLVDFINVGSLFAERNPSGASKKLSRSVELRVEQCQVTGIWGTPEGVSPSYHGDFIQAYPGVNLDLISVDRCLVTSRFTGIQAFPRRSVRRLLPLTSEATTQGTASRVGGIRITNSVFAEFRVPTPAPGTTLDPKYNKYMNLSPPIFVTAGYNKPTSGVETGDHVVDRGFLVCDGNTRFYTTDALRAFSPRMSEPENTGWRIGARIEAMASEWKLTADETTMLNWVGGNFPE